MEDPWHVEVLNACTGERMLGPLLIYPTEKVGNLMRRLQHHHACNVRANDDPSKRFKIIFRGCELHPLDDMEWAILDGRPFPMPDTTQKIVLKAIAEPVLLSWHQFVAMPAIRDLQSAIDDAHIQLIRPLRRLCNETGGNAIDISNSAYDWRQLLKIIPTHSTRQLIGPGITGVAFWHVNSIEDDREIFPLNPIDCEDACSFFEITSANGDQWHINIHTSADSQLTCSLDHFPFPDS